MKKRQSKGRTIKVVSLEGLEQPNLNATGLDAGDDEILASMAEGRDASWVRVFGTFTADLHPLANWPAKCGVDMLAIESTGAYWFPVYEVLGGRGFKVAP